MSRILLPKALVDFEHWLWDLSQRTWQEFGSALVRPIVLVIRSSSHAYVGEPEMSGADGRGA